MSSTSRLRAEEGLLATPVLFVVWAGLVVAIAVVDVGAYVVAAARAQAAADAAALAVVSLEVEPAVAPPLQVARAVARRNRARVEACTCRVGTGRAEVEVSVPVDGLFIPRVSGAQRVTASARAELAPAAPIDQHPVPSPQPASGGVVVSTSPGDRRSGVEETAQ